MVYRIWRSPYSSFGGTSAELPDDRTDETYTAPEHYKDELLREIAANGFNGIWIHARFAHITHTDAFPESGVHAGEHLDRLSGLIERAERYGIKVFLYGQPLRSVPEADRRFWRNHAECAGQTEYLTEENTVTGVRRRYQTVALCSSVDAVKSFVEESAAQIAEKLPGLGGVILITATEFPGHCYQRRHKVNPTACYPLIECPRCREREPWEVAAELITLFRNGIRRHSADISVIAWNWSWQECLPAPCRPLLELLPRDVVVMADFERGGVIDLPERPGFEINEYSLLYPGPSESFQNTYHACRELGMNVMSKLQLGATHELGSVVSLPNMINIRKKALWHRTHPDAGYMGCWNFGNFFSANTCAFNWFLNHRASSGEETELRDFAEFYFQGCDSLLVYHAWRLFESAMRHLPFCIGPLYYGVQTYALAYTDIYRPGPLEGTYAGCSYLRTKERGDDLSPACEMHHHEFSLTELAGAYAKTAAIWNCGVSLLKAGLKGCDDKGELGNAVLCGMCWASTENAYRAYALRKEWSPEKIHEFRHIVNSELDVLTTALPYVENDVRQGFHGEAGYRMFDPELIRRKIKMLQRWREGA